MLALLGYWDIGTLKCWNENGSWNGNGNGN